MTRPELISSAPRSLALDGLRGVACLLVYFFHLGLNFGFGPIVLIGSTGVHLFFVLSGYLMFSQFLPFLDKERPRPNLWHYAVRRATRIYPPYLVSLILYTLLRYVKRTKPPGPGNFTTHVLLIFNYFDPSYYFTIHGIYWSLAIEAQFYVLLPMIVVAIASIARGRWAAPLVIVAFLAIGLGTRYVETGIVADWPTSATDSTIGARPLRAEFRSALSHFDMFGLGMLAALMVRRRGEMLTGSVVARWALLTIGAGIMLLISSWIRFEGGEWQTGGPRSFLTLVPFGLCLGGSMIVLSAATWPRGGPMLLTNRVIVFVGMISYSLYLYHSIVQYAVINVVGYDVLPGQRHGLQSFLMGMVALPPALLAASVMYYLVEAPSTRWGQRYSQRPRAAAANAGS